MIKQKITTSIENIIYASVPPNAAPNNKVQATDSIDNEVGGR